MTLKHAILAVTLLAAATLPAQAERIKDIVDVKGVRGNPLWGYGLVVGLAGTGDNSPVSQQALTNLLRRSGLVLKPSDLGSKNIASVVVTAELGPFNRCGSTLDVTVNTIGSASSLQGGTLLMTPLIGADGETYAVAQGHIVLGGFASAGMSASISKNHATVGRIPSGATVEKEELATIVENGQIVLQLKNPDYTTAESIAKAINERYDGCASAVDAGTVRITLPKAIRKTDVSKFVDIVGSLQVKVDTPALVVINERTGTVVVGENVGISTVAISHGNLSIVTQEKNFASQPAPFSNTGETAILNRTKLEAIEEKGSLHVVPRQVSVAELARALNAMGLTPRDLIAIFEALRQAGALQAQIKVM